MPWPQQLNARRAPRLVAAWAVSALALLLLLASLWPTTPLHQMEGFSEAVAHLQAEGGGFVVVWPPHYAETLQHLPAALTAADAVPNELPKRRRHLRIQVLGPAGFRTPPELEDAADSSRQRFADLEVGTYAYRGGDRVTWDLRAQLRDVQLSLDGPDGPLRCDQARPDGGWGCPGRPAWNNVSPTSLPVDNADWACVWAHPVTGHRLVLDLGQRALADRIEVQAALRDDATTQPGGAGVTIRLEVEGLDSKQVVRSNRPGIARLVLPTPRGQTAGVRLIISTPNDGRRHLGINAAFIEDRVP